MTTVINDNPVFVEETPVLNLNSNISESNNDSNDNNNTNSGNPESVLEPREEVVNTNSKQTSEEEYDPALLDSTFDSLSSLVQGMDYNQNNWMLLLSKAMMLVLKIKK